jgi:hypothetical protein
MREHDRVQNQIVPPVTVYVGNLHIVQQVNIEVARVMPVLRRRVIPLRKGLGRPDGVKSKITDTPE